MRIDHYIDEKMLKIYITEEIDHHTSSVIRTRLDYEISRFRPKKVIINLEKVKFMDSAGIGLIIGRYKITKSYGGCLEIENTSQKLMSIFEMAGLQKIITFNENKKEEVI